MVIAIAGGFGFRMQVVSGDDNGCGVGGTTTLSADSANMRAIETKQIGKSFGSCLLNHCKCRRNLIHVDLTHQYPWPQIRAAKAYIGIQYGEQKLGYNANL